MGQDINPKKDIDKTNLCDNITNIMTHFKESLYETHRELDLILATCKKRDIFMWAQLAIIKWNLGLIIDAVNARDEFVRQMRQHHRNSRIR